MGTTLIPPFAGTNVHRDQALAALAQANRVRLRRASLMRWPHGTSSAESYEKAAELILEPDPTVHSMLTLDLLQRIRGVGPSQANECSNSPTDSLVQASGDRPRLPLAQAERHDGPVLRVDLWKASGPRASSSVAVVLVTQVERKPPRAGHAAGPRLRVSSDSGHVFVADPVAAFVLCPQPAG
jgi:hypothetical protein